jgi:HlyD family secretion protein
MRRNWLLAGTLVAAGILGLYFYIASARPEANATPYRNAAVERGDLTAMVRASGTINPVTTVLVSSQLSGQVVEILSDYNDLVKAGQVVARIASDQIKARRDAGIAELEQAKADLAVKQARVERATASLARAKAALGDTMAQRERAQSQLAEARRAFERQSDLYARGSGARVTLDTAKTQNEVSQSALASAEAQIVSAKAEITGLEADLKLAKAETLTSQAAILGKQARLRDIEIDLERTDIRSPVAGVVVQKSVELGQTVAASLSAPTLFQIAQDLSEIEIHTNVDESDVGRIKAGQRASFSVNAYPNREFSGSVKQVRLGAQTVQNVVIYTTVISVRNEDMALLPGMTANVQILTDERRDILKVPNAALRWRPPMAQAEAPAPRGENAALPGFAPPAANPFSGRPDTNQSGMRRRLDDLSDQIRLQVKPSAEQWAAIEPLFKDARERFSREVQAQGGGEAARRRAIDLRRDLNQAIRSKLDAERQVLYDALIARLQADQRQGQAQATRQTPDAANGTPGRVYVLDQSGKPQAVPVRLGVSDGAMTQIIGQDLQAGQMLIVGGGPKTPQADGPRMRLF